MYARSETGRQPGPDHFRPPAPWSPRRGPA